jgi:hypothetical protein
MPSTYTPIATTTLGSAQSTVTFSSIPSTYTDLVLISSSGLTTATGDTTFTFNTDTASNYSFTALYGTGSTAASIRSANRANISIYESPTTVLGATTSSLNIFNYANATTYKTTVSRGTSAGAITSAVVGLWRSTAAINQIVIANNGSTTFITGSTFTLYGIKAA